MNVKNSVISSQVEDRDANACVSNHSGSRTEVRKHQGLEGPRTYQFEGQPLPVLIARNQYGFYSVPLSSYHRPAAQDILCGKVYEPETIHFISNHCGGGSIVHAGTYFGDFLPALGKSCRNEFRVWAFEPNPENYRCAELTVHLNGLSNAVLSNAGLGATATTQCLKVKESGVATGGASTFVHAELAEEDEVVAVDLVTLDDEIALDEHISVIHLDVEGYEKKALSGARRTIERCAPILVLEEAPSQEWLERNLPLPYAYYGNVDRNTVLMPRSKGR